MVNTNFDSLVKSMHEGLSAKGFELKKEETVAWFYNEKLKYKIEFDNKSSRLNLYCLNKTENQNLNDEWVKRSTWLFDENTSTKDIALICEDFIGTICAEKPKKYSKGKKGYSDKAADALFFANRFVGIFPELRKDIYVEKEAYSEFRGTVFTKENILPKIICLLSEEGKDKNIEKLFKLLNDLYKNSSLNIRSLITMGILNNITEHSQIDKAKRYAGEELKKAWACSVKFAKRQS